MPRGSTSHRRSRARGSWLEWRDDLMPLRDALGNTPGGGISQNDPVTGAPYGPGTPWWLPFLYLAGGIGGGAAAGAFSGAADAGEAAAAGAGTTGSTVPVTGALAPGLASSGAVDAATAAGTGAATLSPALQAEGWSAARVAKLALSLGIPAAT